MYIGRLAPSPTGALHLGNVRTFMIAWLRARSLGGRLLMRMEDLDHPRDKPGAAAAALEDLRWLGFDWDGSVVTQSSRRHLYRAALTSLTSRHLAYPCTCSRRDVESAQSAPHSGDQLFYPGTCRNRYPSWQAACTAVCAQLRQPCWRFVVREGVVRWKDEFIGERVDDVAKELGDFPLARDEDGAGYTLAVVVDDAQMGVTEVVRGDDLVAATPAQLMVYEALGLRAPAFCHVPLVVGADGRRLAKRHGDTRVASFRADGVRAERILGALAASCGWCGAREELTLRELLPRFTLATISREPFVWRGFA